MFRERLRYASQTRLPVRRISHSPQRSPDTESLDMVIAVGFAMPAIKGMAPNDIKQ